MQTWLHICLKLWEEACDASGMVRAGSTIIHAAVCTIDEPCPYVSPLVSCLLGTPVFCRCRMKTKRSASTSSFLSKPSSPSKPRVFLKRCQPVQGCCQARHANFRHHAGKRHAVRSP
jgi:hypothetical protein